MTENIRRIIYLNDKLMKSMTRVLSYLGLINLMHHYPSDDIHIGTRTPYPSRQTFKVLSTELLS